MKIEVLATGCYKCIALEGLLDEVLAELGRSDVTVERVSDERIIRKSMPVDSIPGLVIDDRLVHTGEVPSKKVLRQWLARRESQTTGCQPR